MPIEKETQLESGSMECEVPKSNSRRSSLIATLGGLLLLTTGFAAGMTTNVLCNKDNQQRRSSYDFDAFEVTTPAHTLELETTQETSSHSLESRATTMWKPSPGLSWTYQLSVIPTVAQLANPKEFDVWNIDLFDTPTASIKTIQAAGSKVICYFSAGTFEEWRPDAAKFKAADKGNAMEDWAGETWLNTGSSNVRSIMAARLDLAVAKGCNAVDPDNMDGYAHDTGVPLTQATATNYVKFLATEANKRGLSIGLKNALDIIPSVLSSVQFAVNEQCAAYDECDALTPFANANKPVFHVEYPKGDNVNNNKSVSKTKAASICACKDEWNFSPIIKNSNLNTWIQKCQ